MRSREIGQRFRLWAWRHYVDLEAREPRLRYLFWEATLACNLACRHCGSDCHRSRDTSLELTTVEAVEMFRQVKRDFGSQGVFVAVTGGEPLVRADLFGVMAEVHQLGFPWGMVTNGWHADDAAVENCRRTGMKTIVISLDGASAASHDWLRGPGSFDRAVAAIDRFRNAGFLSTLQVTTTVHRRNLDELDAMFAWMQTHGVRDWRVLSVFPNGRARRQDDLLLEPSELRRLLDFVRAKRSRSQPLRVSYGDEGFLGPEYERRVRDFYFACLAGVRIASVLADGGIGGCPNVPRSLVQGNIRTDRLKDVWEGRFQPFRDRSWMRRAADCAACAQFPQCRGNSMHLWDTELGGPKMCHHHMLACEKPAGRQPC
jgi:radical SAM protein with 4Fe4S-binding SPASM domain